MRTLFTERRCTVRRPPSLVQTYADKRCRVCLTLQSDKGVSFFIPLLSTFWKVPTGEKADADTVRAPFPNAGINHLYQTGAILSAAAVLIGTVIEDAEELVRR